MSRKLSINYFSPQILQISQIFILSDRVELKKTSKTPLVMAEVYRPDVLSFRPVLKSELLHSPQVHHGFLQKLSPHSGKKHKKTLLTAVLDPRILLFYVFARRRGDFAEMMGVRGEGRGACSPELTSSQTSRHAVPTASTGVFSVFFNIAGGEASTPAC